MKFTSGDASSAFLITSSIALPCITIANSLVIDGGLDPLVSRGEIYSLALIQYAYSGAIVCFGLILGYMFRSRVLAFISVFVALAAIGVTLIATDILTNLGEGEGWGMMFGTSMIVTIAAWLPAFILPRSRTTITSCGLLLFVFVVAYSLIPP